MNQLTTYDRKRDFNQTREPRGGKAKRGHRYLVQKHDASHLHYDFRLEVDGVLKSWAVPKQPTLDPKAKRLAVQTEDHPLEYASFEGKIPKGQYGGGTVELWDTGRWEPIGDARQGLKKGKLDFRVFGKRLHGRWALVRMGKPSARKANWLLIKARDEKATKISKPAKVSKLIEPQLATLVDEAPKGKEWIHETKYDGYRVLAYKDGARVTLRSRNGNDLTDRFPAIAESIARLKAKVAVLDGEVAAVTGKGLTDFQTLQNSIQEGATADVRYFLFDLLRADGEDLRSLPLIERKARLAKLFPKAKKLGPCVYSDHIKGKGEAVFKKACRLGMEGIISKSIHSPYVSSRSAEWLKVKCVLRQEFVIGGFTEPAGARSHFGALLLGYFNDQRKLVYVGNVGTGFTNASLSEIHKVLAKKGAKKSPFHGAVADSGGVHWVKPVQVAEIQFHQWTRDKMLRQASFKGLRSDKPAKAVTLEKPKLRPRQAKRGGKLTHPDKVLFKDEGLTKQDLVNYYEKVADRMLPFVSGRPLSLVRCPAGSDKACFFQRHPHETFASPVKTFEDAGEKLVYVESSGGLAGLVQFGALEIHPWASTIEDLERPDNVTFDLDPAPNVPWKETVAAAKLLRKTLDTLGLRSFVKTTGGKGLHVVVPIRPECEWEEVRDFARAVSERLAESYPDRFLATSSKAKRKGKIFLDYLRNARGATSVGPYSTRARGGATVAMPLRWEDLSASVRAEKYNVAAILAKGLPKSDPWEGYFDLKQRLRGVLPH